MAKSKKEEVDRALVNPYRQRVKDYPTRIFCFEDFEGDRSLVQEQISRVQDFSGDFIPGDGPLLEKSGQFGREALFVEIGSGSGIHLIEQGRRLRHAIFFGFELRFKRAVRTIEKAEKYGITNVFVLNCDASEMAKIFNPASLDGLYINFPDPWAKPKQLKHRLFSPTFLDSAAGLLKPGAFVSFKTDHEEYFLSVLDLFAKDNRFSMEHVSHDLHRDDSQVSHENVMTEFEQMFIRQSLPVGSLSMRLK